MRADAEGATQLQGQMKHWAYNALDCTGTREVWDTLAERLDPCTDRYYSFCLALQNPAMAMMRRGVRIDQEAVKRAVKDLTKELEQTIAQVNEEPLCKDKWDGVEKETGICAENNGKRHRWPKGEPDETRCCSLCGVPRMRKKLFNPQSSQQTKRLLYVLHGLPELRGKDGAVTVDDDALERIGRKWIHLRPLTDAILSCRGVKKQLGFLASKLADDGRWRQSVNVGAAWTGRFSSSKNPFGEGNNMANVAERHRYVFLADPGMEMCYADLKTAESQTVAYLAGDTGYIHAHASGDVHTTVARMVWPGLGWTGDLQEDKERAKVLCPEWDDTPGHDFRFQAKRIQHGSNYGLSPQGIALIAKIPVKAAKAAQAAYFEAFPGIRAWQLESIRPAVKASMPLENPLGFRVRLFGRPWDDHTWKQGLAFKPQSTVAMLLNLGMWKVWKDLDPGLVQLLGNVYDAILCQWQKERREEAMKAVAERLSITTPVTDMFGVTRDMTIPVELAVGENWGKRGEDNPKGLA